MDDKAPTLASHDGVEPPPSGKCEWLETPVGKLRCATWRPTTEKERGTIILVHGLSEQIEKYYEAVGKMLDRGFCVAMMDWLGHGRSDPCPANRKEDFRAYDEALLTFVEQKVSGTLPGPYVGTGHSMGGCLMCCFAHDHPDKLDACVLCSPMLGVLATKKAPFLSHVGKALSFTPDSIRQKVNQQKKFDGRFTSDDARFDRHQALIKANPDLLPKYDFVHWFNSSNTRLAKMRTTGWYEAISTPMLILLSGSDTLVDNTAAITAASNIEGVQLEVISHAWHELFMEKDTIQLPLWEFLDNFLDQHAPSEKTKEAEAKTEETQQDQPSEQEPPDEANKVAPTPSKLVLNVKKEL